MYVAIVNREEFLDVLGSRRLPKLVQTSNQYDPTWFGSDPFSVVLLWNKKPRSATDRPNVIVVDDQALREFLAYTSTYVGTYFPFSAFFRVLGRSELEEIATKGTTGDWAIDSLRPLLGVIVAEAFMQVGDQQKSLSDLAIQACLSTYSSVVARSLVAGYSAEKTAQIGDLWVDTRRLIRADTDLRMPAEILKNIWKIIAISYASKSKGYGIEITEKEKLIIEILRSVNTGRPLSKNVWSELTRELPELVSALEGMRGTKEDGVREFDKLFDYLGAADSVDKTLREFLAAYLMAQIADGSMKYISLVSTVNPILPAVPIWFGLINASLSQSDVLTAGNCLGRRLAKAFSTSAGLFENPDRDIAFAELELLHANGGQDIKFRTEHAAQLYVELFPDVVGRFRIRRDATEPARKSIDVRANVVAARIGELRSLLRRAQEVAEDLAEVQHGDLFGREGDESGRKRRGKR